MEVLITGIEGFVASYLAKLYFGKAKVHGTYLDEPKEKNQELKKELEKLLNFLNYKNRNFCKKKLKDILKKYFEN